LSQEYNINTLHKGDDDDDNDNNDNNNLLVWAQFLQYFGVPADQHLLL